MPPANTERGMEEEREGGKKEKREKITGTIRIENIKVTVRKCLRCDSHCWAHSNKCKQFTIS